MSFTQDARLLGKTLSREQAIKFIEEHDNISAFLKSPEAKDLHINERMNRAFEAQKKREALEGYLGHESNSHEALTMDEIKEKIKSPTNAIVKTADLILPKILEKCRLFCKNA